MLFLVVSLVAMALPSHATLKTLVEWKFNTDGDLAGWASTSQVENLAVKDGYLTGHVIGIDPSIASPKIEITATPYQFVEIRMRSTRAGSGELFYTNTTEEPYGGFRPNLMRQISFKDGDFQVYRIFPYWQGLGKIICLRIDPPQDADFAIDYIKVMEFETTSSRSAFFDFTNVDQAWYSADDLQTELTADGITVKAPGAWMLVSPRLNLDSSALPIFHMTAKSTGAQSAILTWLSDQDKAVRSTSIPLHADGRWHAYNIMLGDTADWSGRIQMLALQGDLSESQQIQIKLAGLTNKSRGQGEFEIKSFGFKDAVNRVDSSKPTVVQAELVNIGGDKVKDEITVRFTISPGNKLSITPTALPSAVGLKPGQSLQFAFEVVPAHPGTSDVTLTIDNAVSSATARTTLTWLSPIGANP